MTESSSGTAPTRGAPAADAPAHPWNTPGEWLRLAVLLLLVVLPRFLALDADPPGNLHVHFITDEGWWAHNARQRALWGHWMMDDHNPPLWSTPVYSFLLWLVYEAFGVGLYQTRLLSALGGAVTCFAVYAFVRRESAPGAAFASAMLLAVDYFLLTNNRVAFTESLQLAFATVAILAALRSRAGPLWAVLSAVCMIAAVLCKPNAVAAGGVIGTLYIALIAAPGTAPGARTGAWRGAWTFTAAFVVLAAVVAVEFVIPNAHAIVTEFSSNMKIGMGTHHRLGGIGRFLWFGYRTEPGHEELIPVGFLIQDIALIAGVAVLAVARLLRLEQRRLTDLERCCWIWIAVTALFIATQSYQPDRRYLLSVPPFAILLALAATEPRDPQADGARPAPPGLLRWLVAWLATGFAIGLLARPWLLPWLHAATANVHFGAESGFNPRTLMLMIWMMSFGVGAAVMALIARRGAGRPITVPALAILFVVLALDLARVGGGALSLHYTIRDTSRALGRLADSLPPERRVAVGNTADTFCLENRIYTFVIRNWTEADMYMNLDGLDRYKPAFGIVTMERDVPVGDREGFDWDDMGLRHTFPCWPDAKGKPRFLVNVYDPSDFHPERPGETPYEH